MAERVELVAVGASAGGVEALSSLMAELPPDLPAAILVVLHVSSAGTSVLAQILQRSGRLPTEAAVDGTPVRPGHVYVAPPDHHLVVADGRTRLERGPRENGHRPAVDPLMRSVAVGYGPRAAGVILSGALDDGTAGLSAIKRAGGWAIAQDPGQALVRGMPTSAIANVKVDAVLRIREIAAALVHLCNEGRLQENGSPMPDPAGPDVGLVRPLEVS